VAKRIPPHVTLLFPFAPAVRVDGVLRTTLRAHFARLRAFDGELERIDRFDGHVWLAPGPSERFVEAVAATCARFPELPPYGGEFTEVVPHLTIGSATSEVPTEEIAAAADAELAPHLPVAVRVDAAWLLVEHEDGTWAADERFPFAE
jgi:2'-5' RNA ligase